MKEVSIQYVPHSEIAGLNSDQRIEMLLAIVKEDKIVLLEGQLKKTEEATLIARTMEQIDRKFKGIELATIYPGDSSVSFSEKVKNKIIGVLLGNRQGLTVVGPATIVRQIKQDPKKIELFSINLG